MAVKKALRFIFRVMLVFVALTVLFVVLFTSGVAPRYLLAAGGGRIGLELSAENIKIGFGGSLQLRRFSAAFADEESPFFTAHNVEISMNSIPALLKSRKAGIEAIRLVKPVLTLSSDETGQLNIAPLLPLGRDRPKRPEPPVIPAVTVINGTVHYKRFEEQSITVSRIQFDGVPVDAETIAFSLSLPGYNTLDGTFNTETLAHNLTLQIEDVAALPDPAREDLPRTFRMQADWSGKMAPEQPGRLAGELNIRHLSLDDAGASMLAAVVIDSESAQAQIKHLAVDPWSLWSSLDDPPKPLWAEGGTISVYFADGQIAIEGLTVSLLGGSAAVDAQLRPQQWSTSRGEIIFNALDVAQVVTLAAFEDAMLSGSVSIEPAADRRAMEPMAVELKLRFVGEVFETAGLQEIKAKGYLGATRLVTNGASIPVFGGQMQPWVSLTRRQGELFAHVIADVKGVEVERVVNTFTGRSGTIPGTLGGTIRGRTSGSLQTLSGSADISLTESDLMHTNIIGALYRAMNLRFGKPDAKGNGTIKIAAHGEKVEIMSFEYFNRGVEVRGAGAIEAVTLGRNSPVSGFVTGSMQPLRGTRIPGMRELDRLMSGLQAGLASVRVEGTLGDTQPRVVPMPEVENAFRALLWQQLGD